jgi:RNA polymerase sigma-70 factor (ECF subfamily)
MTEQEATRLFYELVWPQRSMVLRTARFLTSHAADADDLAQETLVKAFKSIAQFNPAARATPEASVRGWLTAILRNTRIDRLRATGRQSDAKAVSLDQADLDFPAPEAATEALDGRDPEALLEQLSDADLIRALRALPEEIRWTLLLVDVEQMDHAEAARILGIPEGTVKSRAHRGREMMRDRLTTAKGQGAAMEDET